MTIPYGEAVLRVRKALDQIARQGPHVEVAPPPLSAALAQLIEEAGPLAAGLDAYFACCNGVHWLDKDDERREFPLKELYSVEAMRRIDTPGFFAISTDYCGDYDLVARDLEVGTGAVVFYDRKGVPLPPSRVVGRHLSGALDGLRTRLGGRSSVGTGVRSRRNPFARQP